MYHRYVSSAFLASMVFVNFGLANEESDQEMHDRVQLRSVTTATGFKQTIKDAPASISVVPKEEILTRPIRDLGDAVQNVPGVDASATKTGDTSISMRGLGSDYVLILIDGKRQNVNSGFHSNGFNGFYEWYDTTNFDDRAYRGFAWSCFCGMG